jgi:NADH dehydrogenase/NADH:ubiquinone oxidoreductase subunit G
MNEIDERYENAYIYKLVCDNENLIYYGSSIQSPNERLSTHKSKSNNTCKSRNLFEKSTNIKFVVIKQYPCKNRFELELEEARYIKNNNCVNRNIPLRTSQEYYKDNKEKLNNVNKLWAKNNKEKTKEIKKRWSDKNKEYNKNYYQNNKEKYNNKETYTCECGKTLTLIKKKRHEQSKYHKRNIK